MDNLQQGPTLVLSGAAVADLLDNGDGQKVAACYVGRRAAATIEAVRERSYGNSAPTHSERGPYRIGTHRLVALARHTSCVAHRRRRLRESQAR